ncbi:calcium/calmodulin-dependent protein kinase type II subunit gamma-like isoform X1 [Mugil cephalus]|uniref:calcium/calmodulin-dependent protein kinase type II subunit gamma-like isoform X1 n=1 Tax=Mugil cephalus TaxID=48193 RepID=UPI001FB68284|nr:calcium/calmodulin-dependent protein kinase type II subunit gamma-like isoform X1 [Mugil cephalus]XP_047441162.1 calcium/calmodulin-dependent protein kinase type II subunit gamma-like isoform X1 [Mugil cephalus]
MGNEQSTLVQKGYVTTENKEKYLIATKEDDTFFIKNIPLERIKQTASALTSEIDTLVTISHPHIVSSKEYFTDQNFYYVVMDYCQGGTLDAKIRGGSSFQQEFEVLSCFVEICLAVKTIHEKGLLHKDLKTESIFLTEFGIACLGGFGKIHENTSSGQVGKINYLAPEVFTDGTYTSKSDIWSLGCILFELCTQKPAFMAETTIKLMPKIIGGPYPSLPDRFSEKLCELLRDILVKDPKSRPTANEILARPIIINCLSTKCKTTVEDLQIKLKNLRALADGLERVHKGTTVGSLTGGVIGAVGGITSIVGLILAPFTLGASLIVTGVGVGVSVAGGATAAASNITNMVNESSDRKAIRNMIKEFEKKINAVVFWLQQIGNSLETIRSSCDSVSTLDNNSTFKTENLVSLGFRAGKGLGGIAELVRLVQVTNIGKIATQASRAVLVAEVATGVLSGLFVAVDVFFIAMDAKEIHHIRKAQAAEMQPDAPRPELLFESEMSDFVPASDQTTLLSDSLMKESDVVENESESQDQSSVRSEIMKFVRSVRNAADNLEKVLNELKTITLSIPSLGYKWEVEWQDMEFR